MKSKGWLALLCAIWSVSAQTFEVAEASIADLQKAMSEGRTTSKALVESYLKRIEAFDQRGPRLNSLILVNPNALREAEAMDRERSAKGPRGPLHGIPVIVKDNYSTSDMQTTAGTMALLGFVPSRDAFQVRKLREAGAIIIAKSNLHELASGITSVGSAFGQTLNPYDPTRNPGGSSGGTGAAIAASFAAAGMGSDTCGSIRIPAAFNNLTGLRPTKGLSSIAGIVPLSTTQDTGGPLARSVDLAVMLDATIGEDPADPATKFSAGQVRPKFMDMLQSGSLKGVRIGVLEPLFVDSLADAEVIRIVRDGIEELKKQGVTIVPVPMPELNAELEGSSVISTEFKEDFVNYLATHGSAPVHSLDEIVKGGLMHSALETLLTTRLAQKGRESHDYKIAMAKRVVLREMILKLMEEQKLDALAYPTVKRKQARIDEPQGGSTCFLSASTGFPAITVPAGFTADGLPVGMELFGKAFDDGKLLSYAYAFEQAAPHRKAPARTPALSAGSGLGVISWQSTATSPAGGTVSARFQFDPLTNALTYQIATNGFAVSGEPLAASLHRKGKEENGPAIAILANHTFQTLEGTQILSESNRAKLMSGDLYLRVALRMKDLAQLRIPLKVPGAK